MPHFCCVPVGKVSLRSRPRPSRSMDDAGGHACGARKRRPVFFEIKRKGQPDALGITTATIIYSSYYIIGTSYGGGIPFFV